MKKHYFVLLLLVIVSNSLFSFSKKSQPLAVTVSNIIPVTCSGACDGSALVTFTGADTGPYTIQWLGGMNFIFANVAASPFTCNGLCPGNYTVRVTGTLTTQVANVVISEPAPIAMFVDSQTNVTCNGLNNGAANVSVIGGTSPYTLQWNDPANQTGTTISNLLAGTYTCAITDANGCVGSDVVTISEPTQLNATAQVTANDLCGQHNGAAEVIVDGGVQPYTYLWSNGANTAVNSGLMGGVYFVDVTDINGCTDNAVVNINDIPRPSLSLINSQDITCYGLNNGSATVSVVGGTLPYSSQSWLLPATLNPNPNQTGNGLWPGNNVYQVIDGAGCISSITVPIEEPNELVSVIVNQVDVMCNGLCDGSGTVIAAGGTVPYTYFWTNLAATATNTNLCAGNYTATVTDANGCEVQSVLTINTPNPLVVSATSTNTPCYNVCDGSATPSVTGGTAPYSFLWQPSLSPSFNATALCDGTHTITVTDVNGCMAYAMTVITEPAPISISIDTTHATSSSNCDGSAIANITGGIPLYTYTWVDPSVGVIGLGQSISNLCVGTYTLNVTDNNGCVMTSVFPIHVETVGLKEMQTLNASIFPNPTNDGSFKIQLNDASYKNLHFNMYNASGAKVMDKNLLNQLVNEITTTGLTSGIYFYQLINADGKKYAGKIVIGN